MTRLKQRKAFILVLLFSIWAPISLNAATFNLPGAASFGDFGKELRIVGASLYGTEWLGNLKNKIIESVNSLPKIVPSAPKPAPVSQEPVNISVTERVDQFSPPSLNEAPPSVSSRIVPVNPPQDLSALGRIIGLENQITLLRNLISRQSDSNSRSVSSAVREVNTIITSAAFDTTAAHSWGGLQEFTNASSTLFSTQYASTTLLCVGGDCRTSWPTSGTGFAYPFLTLTGNSIQATSSIMNFNGGILTSASSTLASTTVTSLLSVNATATDLYVGNIASTTQLRANTSFLGFLTSVFGSFTNVLANGSSTFQALGATSATGTNLYATNFLANSSSTFQALGATSATATNLYATSFLANGSSTFQRLFSTSATGTNLYATNFLATASSSFQGLFSTSATATNLFSTNFLALGSSTLQAFTAFQGTITSATSTNLFATNFLATGSSTLQSATSTNFYASSALNIGTAVNFINRSTTTLTVNDTAWVIATSSAVTGSPLMSFNNSAGTSTIQFFGATTTGLTAGTGMGIPMGNFVLIGDGRAPAGLNILKGGLCVDLDGWCTASTTGRISSVSSFIGGADLAEMYQASEYLEPGDVVAIIGGISVAKATRGGRDKMMGVISTKPGIVLGTGPDAQGHSGDVPVALTGRVPVKVSAENGAIHAGDYLVLSSVTGVGAKATKAGTTIGQALEDYSASGVGKILVFVKNSYYSGLSLDSFPGLTTSAASTPEAMLVALQNGAENGSAISSDLTVDRMLAAVEIITPKLTAGLISAQKIESPTITALSDRITTEVASLQSQIGSTNAALTSLTDRVAALERASTTSFSLALVTQAVNNFMTSTANWVVSNIEAQLVKAAKAIFTRLCLADESGETCITRGELEGILHSTGQSGSPAPVPPPTPEPESNPEPDPEAEVVEPTPELEETETPVETPSEEVAPPAETEVENG